MFENKLSFKVNIFFSVICFDMWSSTHQKSSHKDTGLINADLEIHRPDGFQDFATLVKLKGFVDRTELIKKFLSLRQPLLVTAPRRFGKSVNLDMIQRFSDIPITITGELIPLEKSENFEIFSKVYPFGQLEIKKDEQFFSDNFGQHPVIMLSFLNIEVCSYSHDSEPQINFEFFIISFRSTVIAPLCKKYDFLKFSSIIPKSDRDYLTEMCNEKAEIEDLTTLEKYGSVLKRSLESQFNKSVVVLIDEIDAVIINIIQLQTINQNDLKKTIEFLKRFLKPLLEEGQGKIGLITGCSKIGEIFSGGINNLCHVPYFSNRPLAGYYSLTGEQVTKMGKDFGANDATIKKIKSWCDGYRILGTNKKVFSLYSVLKSFQNPHFESHLSDTNFLRPFSGMFLKPFVGGQLLRALVDSPIKVGVSGRYEIEDVMSLKTMMEIQPDKKLEPNLISEHMENVFLRLLFEEGYFTFADDSKLQASGNNLVIPTISLKMEFRTLLKEAMYIQYNIDDEDIHKFIETLIRIDGTEETLGMNLQSIVSLVELSRFKPRSASELSDLFHHALFVDDEHVAELGTEVDNGEGRYIDLFTILKEPDPTGKTKKPKLKGIIFDIKLGLATSPIQAVNRTLAHSYSNVYKTDPIKKKYPVVDDKLIIGLVCTDKSCGGCYLYNSLKLEDEKMVRVSRKGNRHYMNFSSASWGTYS